MARRIAGVGRVTVSLRRSTMLSDWDVDIFSDCPCCEFLLAKQFHEDFVRNTKLLGRETHDASLAFDKPGGFEGREFAFEGVRVRRCDRVEIDAGKLTQAEKNFFFMGLPRGYRFYLLSRKLPGFNGRDVLSGVVRVGPASCSAERVGPGAKSEIRFAAPIFEVMARSETRLGPVGDFIVFVAR